MDITKWLLEQLPAVVIMGVMLYSMFRYIRHKDCLIKEKDGQMAVIVEKVLTVAALWDVKSDLNTKEHEELKGSIEDLRDMLMKISYSLNNK